MAVGQYRQGPEPNVIAPRLRGMRPQPRQTLTAEVEGIRLEPGAGPLARLYEAHAARAFRLAYLLTGDHDVAEDLVQDAFVKLIGRFADLRSPESFDVYLRRTVVTMSYGLFRRRRTERAYLAREQGLGQRTSDVLPDFEREDELSGAVTEDRAPPARRACPRLLRGSFRTSGGRDSRVFVAHGQVPRDKRDPSDARSARW
jgi:DNA-directed RNA polymerase specialized sigma24 family protein